MFRIENMEYGFKITTTGAVDLNEVEQMKRELLDRIAKHNHPCSIVVDARRRIPFDAEAAHAIEELHKAALQTRVQRVAIIIDSPIIKGQALQIGYNSHTDTIDRIIDATKSLDWEEQAIAWAAHGIEPNGSSNSATNKATIRKGNNVYD